MQKITTSPVASKSETLDLSILPPVFVLSTHLEADRLHELEDHLSDGGAPLTYDVSEAKIFLGLVEQKRRAAMELRSLNLYTEEATNLSIDNTTAISKNQGLPRKRPRLHTDGSRDVPVLIEDSSTESEPEVESTTSNLGRDQIVEAEKIDFLREIEGDNVKVVKISWLEDCLKMGRIVHLDSYTVYEGKPVQKPMISQSSSIPSNGANVASQGSLNGLPTKFQDYNILNRAKADPNVQEFSSRRFKKYHNGASGHSKEASYASTTQHPQNRGKKPALLTQSTTEHDEDVSQDLPEMPQWVKDGCRYACERSTVVDNPNIAFIEQLKKIRTARVLTADEIGIRAYSTAIAAIAAYPNALSSPREVLSLPGCETKIAALFMEWKNYSSLQAVRDMEADEYISTLLLFYDIWGVGAYTAREFWNNKWRSLDDLVEFNWKNMSRVQQIGVKYYDEFLQKIPRPEVEGICKTVHEHMQRLREPDGVRTCIVGGYRRGKAQSGDADIIVTHLEDDLTLNIINEIVDSLIDEGWITHSLGISTSGTRRAQNAVAHRVGGGGHGFDTLDKAMVVWQDPTFDKSNDNGKNPNIHRRVDIIVAPWSKIGCAVLGWSAGTTFERDLRRYSRSKKGWKFDSSGITDVATGMEIDLESIGGKCTEIEQAERKVFKGLGLTWRAVSQPRIE